MRETMVRLAAAVIAVVACGGLAFGQADSKTARPASAGADKPKQEKPATLDEMLAKALKDNPDIRVAESKVREAEAELNRVRLQVTQKIVALQSNLEAERAAVQLASRLLQTKYSGAAEVEGARASLLKARAKLAELESEMPYLLGTPPKAMPGGTGGMMGMGGGGGLIGMGGGGGMMGMGGGGGFGGFAGGSGGGIGAPRATQPVQGSMAEKLRKALDTRVKVDYKKKSFHAILKDFQKRMPGVSFQILLAEATPNVNPEVQPSVADLRLEEEVPLGAAFQLLEDSFAKVTHSGGVTDPPKEERIQFVVRDYGILVAAEKQIPPGAVKLHEFWKTRVGQDDPFRHHPAERDSSTPKNPPAEDIKGKVKAVDAESGLATISIGSDAGLQKGHTLEVYRLKPRPTYVGTLRILEVKAKEAVGKQVEPRHRGAVQVGDEVASRITEKR